MNKELTVALSALGLCDSGVKADLMIGYMRLVLERNQVMNLTAITDEAEFVKKHLLDSVTCYGRPEIDAAKSVVDIGTGAGFPGVPLAICYPDKEFLLIDSLAKRTSFIEEACAKLGVNNASVLHSRAEDAGKIRRRGGNNNALSSASSQKRSHTDTPAPPLRESFDLALSRAVAHLAVLYEYCLPLVKPGGAFYAYKSESQIGEINESKKARLLLGAAVDAEVWGVDADKMSDPQQNSQTHIIIITRKETPTPKAYPRKAGTPAKIPIISPEKVHAEAMPDVDTENISSPSSQPHKNHKNCANCYSLCCSYRGKVDKPCPKETKK